MIAYTLDEWKSCIVNDCKIELTKSFAQKRLRVYENSSHPETKKFRELYGEQHLKNVINWFRTIL